MVQQQSFGSNSFVVRCNSLLPARHRPCPGRGPSSGSHQRHVPGSAPDGLAMRSVGQTIPWTVMGPETSPVEEHGPCSSTIQ